MPVLSHRAAFASELLRIVPSESQLWVAWSGPDLREVGGGIAGEIEVRPLSPDGQPPTNESPARRIVFRLTAHGSEVLRLRFGLTAEEQGSAMLTEEPSATALRLVREAAGGYSVFDEEGRRRANIPGHRESPKKWSNLLPASPDILEMTLYPDGVRGYTLASQDHFFPGEYNALPLAQVTGRDDQIVRTTIAFEVEANECFSGTGERFAKIDLSGRTVRLVNEDALGVNNRRCYKNVPFVYCTRGAGLFFHTSAETILSLADVSTRSLIAAIEDAGVDLFLIGGGSPQDVLFHYRRLTGIPPQLPRWTFGVWMAKMTYFSEAEIKSVCRRLREDDFPCDVIHLDTGWFERDWVCEWRFSEARFPDPQRFFADLRSEGFRVSLWQNINLGPGNRLLPEAIASGYVPGLLAPASGDLSATSDFSAQEDVRQVDFTNPEAEGWYRQQIGRLFELGAAVIKTDFGETIRMDAAYRGMPARRLRNIYALLYQRAAFEETKMRTGSGVVWARAGWAGCQRYPIHWGGDSAATWEGMAASLRGGLHLGLSGFAHWSHDVPGFHGLPDFMNSRPSDKLMVRWTQFGVFTSHLRYHGTNEREPYAYPGVAEVVRQWLYLRYALIPYLEDSAAEAGRTGYPMMRAMLFEAPLDSVCHHIDDQYLLGSVFLVAPVMNEKSRRNIYLPAGRWTDLWTGEIIEGPQWVGERTWPLIQCPVYARTDSTIRIYPIRVRCTDDMEDSKIIQLCFDQNYRGFGASLLGLVVCPGLT